MTKKLAKNLTLRIISGLKGQCPTSLIGECQLCRNDKFLLIDMSYKIMGFALSCEGVPKDNFNLKKNELYVDAILNL